MWDKCSKNKRSNVNIRWQFTKSYNNCFVVNNHKYSQTNSVDQRHPGRSTTDFTLLDGPFVTLYRSLRVNVWGVPGGYTKLGCSVTLKIKTEPVPLARLWGGHQSDVGELQLKAQRLRPRWMGLAPPLFPRCGLRWEWGWGSWVACTVKGKRAWLLAVRRGNYSRFT